MKYKGFSLIELMIVIAIIGVLASVAIPNYQLYVNKSKITEVIGVLESFKPQIVEYYSANGTWPSTLSLGGVSIPVTGSAVALTGFNNIVSVTAWNTNVNGGFVVELAVSAALGGGVVDLAAHTPSTDTRMPLQFYCGLWDTQQFRAGINNLTLKSLPSTCNAQNLSVLVNS